MVRDSLFTGGEGFDIIKTGMKADKIFYGSGGIVDEEVVVAVCAGDCGSTGRGMCA